jgi:tRNA G10  N-methylase Trm11
VSLSPPLIALFYGRLGDSRLAEFEAVALRLGASAVRWTWDRHILEGNGGDVGPSVVQPLPPLGASDHGWLADAAARSVGCRGVFEVWGAGDSVEACAAQTAALSAEHFRERVRGSWRVDAVVLGSRRSQHPEELGARMRTFGHVLDALEVRPVDLSAPEHRLWLVEDRRVLSDGGPLPGSRPIYRLLYQLPAREPPIEHIVRALDLRKRAFLSTSSTPARRALLLCNLALAGAPRSGARLLDPYCGSGSLLLAAAALGAWTVGSDLDGRVVSDSRAPVRLQATADRPGRGVEAVRLRDNFDEAGLPQPLALLTLDVGAPEAAARLLAGSGGRPFDALVCDPPYGRREFQQGVEGWDGALTYKVTEAALGGTLTTLLRLARATLGPRGRLVFLTPIRAPSDASKPELETLRGSLERDGAGLGLRLVHLGVEAMHRGLHRAVVVLERRSA